MGACSRVGYGRVRKLREGLVDVDCFSIFYWVGKLSIIRTNGLLVFGKICPLLYEYSYPELTK